MVLNNSSKLSVRFRLFILGVQAIIMKREMGTYMLLMLAHHPYSFSYENIKVLVMDWKARHRKK